MKAVLLIVGALVLSSGCASRGHSLSDELGLTVVDPRVLRPQQQINCTSIQTGNRVYTECQ